MSRPLSAKQPPEDRISPGDPAPLVTEIHLQGRARNTHCHVLRGGRQAGEREGGRDGGKSGCSIGGWAGETDRREIDRRETEGGGVAEREGREERAFLGFFRWRRENKTATVKRIVGPDLKP